jgi:hypothetical protein
VMRGKVGEAQAGGQGDKVCVWSSRVVPSWGVPRGQSGAGVLGYTCTRSPPARAGTTLSSS